MKHIRGLKSIGLILVLAAGAACANAGQLRAGASRIEFTQLAARPDIPSSGKFEHEKLFLRAIVLDSGTTRIALITVDGAPSKLLPDRVAAELKCPVENVIASGSTSHAARLAAGGGTRDDQAMPSPVDDLAVKAVREAAASMQPARVSFGVGHSYLNVNREAIDPITRLWTQAPNLAGPSDKSVPVLKFENLNGDLIALYTSYGMQAVNDWLSGITSADWVGAASRFIEQIYDDKVVAEIAQSTASDQNPLYLRASTAQMVRRGGDEYHGQPMVRETIEQPLRDNQKKRVPVSAKETEELEEVIQAQGIIFAEEVLRVVQEMQAGRSDVRIGIFQETVTCPGRTRLDKTREGGPGTYTDGPDVGWIIRVIGIGDVGLVTINSGISTTIEQEIKAKSPLTNTMYVSGSLAKTNSTFAISDDAYGHYTYEELGTLAKPGCAQASLENAAVRLLTKYGDGGFADK